jgi:hypothetical protein
MRQEQLKIGLPSDLRQKLDAEAASTGGSLGSVIRMWLEAFRYSKETRAIGRAAMELAEGLARATDVPWIGHPMAAAALAEALKVYINERQQKLTPGEVDPDNPGTTPNYPFEFEYDPETTGKLLARGYLQRLAEDRKMADEATAEDEAYAKREGQK